MTFRDELTSVRTEQALDELMWRMRRTASANWTLDSAQRFVARDLWSVLNKHFDVRGMIRRDRWTYEPEEDDLLDLPADSDGPAWSEEDEEDWWDEEEDSRLPLVEAQRAGQVEKQPNEGSKNSERRRAVQALPIVEVITRFHERLEALGGQVFPAVRLRGASPDAKALKEAVASKVVSPPIPAVEAVCPICAQDVAKLVSWRGGELCEPCMSLLRQDEP